MLSKRRLISLILTLFMLCSYVPSVSAASGTQIVFSQGFNTLPTNGGASSDISVEGGSSIKVVNTKSDNKALQIGLNDASAKLSFPAQASDGVIWLGIRFRLTKNIETASMFQIIDASGSKLNLINLKEDGTSLYDGKVFGKLRKQLWTDLHVKLDYNKKNFSVYVDGKCVLNEWKITTTIPTLARVGFEFSNPKRNATMEIDHLIAYTGNKLLKEYPVEKFNTDVAKEQGELSQRLPGVYVYEDFNAMNFNNATGLHQTPFDHIIEVRNLKGRNYYEDGDRMYQHMERLAGVPGYPHYEVTIKDFDATSYVIDMTINIFELNGSGFELTLKKSNTTKFQLITASENGILKCGGAVFNYLDFNRWTRLSFVLDSISSSYDVYVDGMLVKEDCSVTGDLKDINQIGFQLVWGSKSGSVGLDEIAVYEGTELKPDFSISNFIGSLDNSYDNVDANVNAFIGNKAVFCVNNSAFYKDGIKTKYEGKGYETFSGVPMGSVPAMAKAYGVSYAYNNETKTATLGNGVSLTVGEDVYHQGEKLLLADGIIEEKDGVVYAPARSFFERVLGKTVSYDSEWLLLFISDDGSYASTEDSAMMRQVMYKMIFDRPSGEEMSKIISEKFSPDDHPRALFNKSDIERVKNLIETDKYAKKLYEYLKLNTDSILSTKPVTFSVSGGSVELARTREDRMTDLGIMYHLTGDERYAARGIEELEEMVEMPYLAWGNALNSGALMAAFCRGYDMLYDKLTPELRTKIEDCVISLWERDLLDGANATGDRNFNYMHAIGNWVPVHNGPYLESTLVFADNPRMSEIAKRQFEISQRSFEGCLADIAPDGACPEGGGYWTYTMLELAPAVKALMNCLGTTLGIEDHIGLRNSSYFMLDITGTARMNAFHDTGKGTPHSSRPDILEPQRSIFLVTDIYKDASLLSAWLTKCDNFYLTYNGTSLMWYNPEVLNGEVTSQLDNRYRGELDYVAMRSSFEDENALFLGGHSGINYMSHSHIDGGTYIIDAMGLNWVCDVGTEDYANNYDPRLGKYYSTRPEAHNVYLINPRTDYQGQDLYESGATIEFESSEKSSYAIVDMSKYYKEDVTMAQRGFKLAGNRSYAVVRDEISLKGNSDVLSFIHTQADIEILDNTRAIFSQFGKKMLVEVTTNGTNVTLEEMACEMLPTSPSPQPDARDMSEYRKLAIKLTAYGNLVINVKFTPLYDQTITSTDADDIALALWEVEEGENDAPRLNAVFADNVKLEEFNPNNSMIRVPVSAGISKAPVITASADENYNIEIIGNNEELLSDTLIKLTDKSNPKNISYYTVRFEPEIYSLDSLDGLKLADIKSIISEDTGNNITEKLTDGNLKTEQSESKMGREYIIDLGSVQNLDAIILAFTEDSAVFKYTYDIEVSVDGNNYTTKTGLWSLGTNGYEAMKLGENVKARYIRFTANGRTGGLTSRLCELRVAVK